MLFSNYQKTFLKHRCLPIFFVIAAIELSLAPSQFLKSLVTYKNFSCNSCYGIFSIVSQFSHVIVAIKLCNFININSLRWDPTGLLRDGFLEHALKGRAYRAFHFVNMGVSVISIVNSIINNTQNKIKIFVYSGPKNIAN